MEYNSRYSQYKDEKVVGSWQKAIGNVTGFVFFENQFFKYYNTLLKMKKTISTICAALILFSCLQAQYYKTITVKAGTKIIEKFPPSVRYQYQQFTDGQVFMILNYNMLLGEIEFLQSSDTMIMSKKKDLSYITVALDTFIYRNGYLQVIHSGKVKVCLRDKIKLKEVVKIGAMGQPNRNSSVDSYNSISLQGNFQQLIPTEDYVFQRTLEFYIMTSSGELIEFRKKNVLELYPDKEKEIQKYLKSDKVNFEEKSDIIRFADFLASL
jgi:hypothetical protein